MYYTVFLHMYTVETAVFGHAPTNHQWEYTPVIGGSSTSSSSISLSTSTTTL